MLIKTISYTVDVEVDHIDQAEERAHELTHGLCHQCIGGTRGEGEINEDGEWEWYITERVAD